MSSWGYSLNTHRTPLQREILASAKPMQGHTQGREKRSPRPFGDIGGLLSFLKIVCAVRISITSSTSL